MKNAYEGIYNFAVLLLLFHSRNTENIVNKIHERALALVYDDSPYLSFEELLIRGKSVSINQRNLQFLAIEIFNLKNWVVTGLQKTFFSLLINPTIYEISVYCLEKKQGSFLWNRKSFFFGSRNLKTNTSVT